MAGEYSNQKVIHHGERLQALREGKQINPVHVQLIISDLCNEDCGFCAYRTSGYSSNQLFGVRDPLTGIINNNPNRMIPLAKCLEILDDCQEMGVKAIQLTGGGEPLVHPHHQKIMQGVVDRGMDLAVVTNGTLFRPERGSTPSTLNCLLMAEWVRVSIDASNRDTYASMRRVQPDMFDRVIANVKQLVEAKRHYRQEWPTIGVGFVVTKENWWEVYDATKLAKQLGVDNIRISAVFQNEEERYFEEFHEDCAALCKQCELQSDENFRVFNNFGSRLADLTLRHPDYPTCGYQQFVTYIGADQNVYRCCVLSYNERGKLGSLANQRFKDLWESEQKRQAIEGFDASGCPRCLYNNTNRTILYAIDTKPVHVNFV